MDRYKVVMSGPRKYVIHDLKYGDAEVATFVDFDLCQQFLEYMNQKDKLISLIYKHASDDADRDFE